MSDFKKPFYKRLRFIILGLIILTIIALFLIPYGLNNRSIGNQLVDTANQFKDQYVYDEKDHWTDEQWNEYWAKHPEYTAVVSDRTDWETESDWPEADDPLLNELPPNYAKLWKVDFHDLETTEQYNAWLNQPILDDQGKPLREEYIYHEKSTGNWIVDVTLDGFILKLDPSYRAGWANQSKTDPNGYGKYRKGGNLQLMKNLGDKVCRIEIAPNDWAGPGYDDKHVDHPLYDVTMRYDSALNKPESPRRFLRVKLDEAPYNTDTYSIEIFPTSPKECFDANLETEVLNDMTFTPPELKGKYLGNPDRFPLPKDWPNPNEKDFLTIKKDPETGKQVLEHPEFGIQVVLEPNWRIESYNDTEMNDNYPNDFKIRESNQCVAFFSKNKAKSLKEWLKSYPPGTERGLGTASYTESNPYKSFPFEAYEVLDREILYGSDEDPKSYADWISKRIGYYFNNQLIEIVTTLKFNDPSEPVSEGQCENFYQNIINSVSPLNHPHE